jgi:hypothetical protein
LKQREGHVMIVTSRGPRTTRLGVLGIGGLFLLACQVLMAWAVVKSLNRQHVKGVVVRPSLPRRSAARPRQYIVYQMGGKERAVEDTFLDSWERQDGATVDLLVQPGQPATVAVNNFTHLWLGPLLTGVLGVGCLFVGRRGWSPGFSRFSGPKRKWPCPCEEGHGQRGGGSFSASRHSNWRTK